VLRVPLRSKTWTLESAPELRTKRTHYDERAVLQHAVLPNSAEGIPSDQLPAPLLILTCIRVSDGVKTYMNSNKPRSVRSVWIIFCVFTVVAAFYLLTEHRAHLLGWLPYLIFLACPLMHVFMHGSHGRAHQGNSTPEKDASGTSARQSHNHR